VKSSAVRDGAPDIRLHAGRRGTRARHLGRALPGAAGRLTRLGDILGADFRSCAIEVRSEREGVGGRLLPTAPSLTRANALGQYLSSTAGRCATS